MTESNASSPESDLPSWAITPIRGVAAAAPVVGVSTRKLYDIIKTHRFYERRGKSYLFYPEHIEELRNLECPSNSSKDLTVGSGKSGGRLTVDAFARAQALLTDRKRSKSKRS
jgi:hypothetical protein